ncbi:BED-type domain-containing protein [Citrus sinensis]|uniref:BED-type domain-containing protein n=1 Tax=Citrus sinensis TaxID=2711 RepID=A0ACB8JMP4_CITSI|nr:BED-type domain-containing protein [Citrus sinensis]
MSNSREDSHVGEENRNDAIPLEGLQEVEGVEEASRGDDGVQQSSNKKKRDHVKQRVFPQFLIAYKKTLSVTRKDDGTSCIETREFDPIVARQKIATLVVKHELPFNFVEYEAFRDLMSYANPLVKNLSRNTLKSEILKLYQAEKAKSMALLENNDSKVAITTDMWTARVDKVIKEWIKKMRDSVAYWTGTPKRVETFEMAARLQQCDKHYTSLPTDEEWEMAERMLEYLLSFYSMTELFSDTQYPTSNLFFPMICEMKINLHEWELSDVPVVREMTGQMIMKFDKYWAQIHGILVMAVILDPRFKMQLVNYYFPQLYGEGAANEIQKVCNLSNDLVKFYEDKNGNVSDAVVGESSSVDVCFNFNVGIGRKFFDISKFEAFASQNSETMKVNQGKYPILAQMANDILVVPVTTVASESMFSTGGKILKSEIFSGEEFMDEDESGPQVLE